MAWSNESINKMPANPNGKWQAEVKPEGGFQFVNSENPNQTIPARPEQVIQFLAEEISNQIISSYLKPLTQDEIS